MTTKISKLVKAAGFLLVALAAVYAAENSPQILSAVGNLNSSEVISGILIISGPEDVLVNGSKAKDGMTIVPDPDIKTPNSTEAQILLNRLGKIEIGCGSTAKVVFTESQVQVFVTEGYARLTTNQGINGTLNLANKEILKTDSKKPDSFVESAELKPNCSAVGAMVITRPASTSYGTSIGIISAVIGGASLANALVTGETPPAPTPTPAAVTAPTPAAIIKVDDPAP